MFKENSLSLSNVLVDNCLKNKTGEWETFKTAISYLAYLTCCLRIPCPNATKCLFTSFFTCSSRMVWTVLQKLIEGVCQCLIKSFMNVF